MAKMEEAVTFKHVVYSLPVVALALTAFGGFVLAESKNNAAPAYIQIAELKSDTRALDAGLKDQLAQLEIRLATRQNATDAKLDRILDRLLDAGTRTPQPARRVRTGE